MKKEWIILFVLFVFLAVPSCSFARTLDDYKNDLKKLIAEKDVADDKTQAVQNEINVVNGKMEDIKNQIIEATKEQEDKEEEIEKTNLEIEKKEEEIKKLVEFYQLSNNENFYLNYVFAAESFEDFIYRFAIVEQLTEANDKLVDEMDALIVANEKAIKDLDVTKEKLNVLNDQMFEEISKLTTEKSEYFEMYESYDDQIATLKEQIKYFEDQGCSGSEDLSVCVADVPFDYGFDKPLNHAQVRSEFGMRVHPVTGAYQMHSGIDLATNSGDPILAAAAGKVVFVRYKGYCGGTYVTINHIINGKAYTTRYFHMLKAYVQPGDIVTKGETIGLVGGGSSTPWDHYTTGPHLHFEIAYGHYYGSGIDSYTSYTTYKNRLINPRNLIYFPKQYTYF